MPPPSPSPSPGPRTEKRKVLIARKAYHGAAPWCTPYPAGTLPEDRAHQIFYDYNDPQSLEQAAAEAGDDLAAIIATAIRHDIGRDHEMPNRLFAEAARKIADRTGAALILDDVRCGFRLNLGGSWELVGVRPDLTAFSKAIANGYALAAVTGKDRFRDAATRIFTTGSFWFQAIPMAAALATLRKLHAIDGVARMKARRAAARGAPSPGGSPRHQDPPERPAADAFGAVRGRSRGDQGQVLLRRGAEARQSICIPSTPCSSPAPIPMPRSTGRWKQPTGPSPPWRRNSGERHRRGEACRCAGRQPQPQRRHLPPALRAADARQLKPDQRLKIRDLALALGVSETPVREAIFQLVRDGAVELKPRHYLRVRRLSLAQYMELREMRLLLEPLAAERALPAMDRAAIAELARSHRRLVAAERARDFDTAVQANFDFHFGITRAPTCRG